MKSEKRKETIWAEYFTCDVCGYESTRKYEMESHEKRHQIESCSHKLTYKIQIDEFVELLAICSICGGEIKKYEITDGMDIPDKVLKPLYDWLKSRKR